MNWTDTYHGSRYLELHLMLLTNEINNHDVDFITDILNLPENSKILDLPCGHGRHSNILAQKGYKVTGIDNKALYLDLAKKNSKELGVSDKVNYILGDMRKLEFENQFDAVLNLFTSFGYFDEKENFETLKRMARSLKIGGRLIMDMANRESVVHTDEKEELSWFIYPDKKVFLANNTFDLLTGRWLSKQFIFNKGDFDYQYQDVRLYTYTEYQYLFNLVGLKIIDVYGGMDKSEYTTKSKSIVLIAEKVN